jgi:two-component system, cell cycle sensor histidine kinase and response regulator CckA
MGVLRLLVIEDSEDDLELVVRELVRADYEVKWERVETARAMRAALERQKWDLVIADYSLPRFSAPEALALLKKLGLDLPFIIVSGTVGEETAVDSLKAGAHDFLSKEKLQRLVPAIERELQQAGQRRARREAEERYRLLAAIVESSDDAIISTDLSGKVLSWNTGAERMYGYAAAEMMGKPIALLEPSERSGEVAHVLQNVEAGGGGQRYETVRQRKDGMHVNVAVAVFPLRDSSGGIAGIASVARDITERKKAEQALRVSEERYRLLFERNLYGVIRSTLEGRIADCNEAAARLLGFGSRDELLGRSALELHVEPGRRQAILSRLRQEHSIGNVELPMRKKDGTVLWTLVSLNLIGGQSGEPELIDTVFLDITDRKRAEEALRESQAFLEKAQEVGHIGSWVSGVGDDDRLVWSKETHRIFGVPEDRFDGKVSTFFSMIHPEDREAVQQSAQAAVEKGEPYAIEHRIVRPDDSIRWVQELADIICDETGHAVRIVGTVQDVTERKQLQAQLVQAQKMEAIGRLAGGVAHDFNNILTAILGYSEVLLTQAGEDHPWREDLEEIRKAGERAAGLTRQLLAFSRKQVLAPEVIDLGAVVANVDKILRRVIGEDIELVTATEPGLAPVRADPGQIEQVILNLAVNARDAMPRGGKLTIETRNVEVEEAYAREHVPLIPGRYVMLSVSDTGTGMDRETRSHIFEPFFTTKERGKGTGLGLSMVYGIVKQSNGYVWVDSEPGKGTIFRIHLPPSDQPREAVSEGERGPAVERTGGGETIFLVEDEDSVRGLARAILQGHGYTVLDFASGEKALSSLARYPDPVHLLLTDVVMPNVGGPELAARVVALRPEVRIVYMSGYTDRTFTARDGGKLDAPLIQKPFTPEALARRVREVLDH